MMDDETIDKIFQGVLEDLPRQTSKVKNFFCPNSYLLGLILDFLTSGLLVNNLFISHRFIYSSHLSLTGCANFHELHFHRHDDGEEHTDAVCVSKTQNILQGETRA